MYVGFSATMSSGNILAVDEECRYVTHYSGEGFIWNLMENPNRVRILSRQLEEVAQRLTPPVRTVELLQRIKRFAVGIAGTDSRYPSTLDRITEYLGLHCHGVQSYIGEVAFLGAAYGKPGILIRSGVGSTVYGINSCGQRHVANSWDRILGDQGSGFHIARLALSVAARQEDGRLTNSDAADISIALARSLNCSSFIQLHQEVLSIQEIEGRLEHVRAISSLSKPVFQLAEMGNQLALGIIQTSADEFVDGVKAVCTMLGYSNNIEIPVVFSGGVVLKEPLFRKLLNERLYCLGKSLNLRFRISRGEFAPVIGAALIAFAGSAYPYSETALTNLRRTLPPKADAPELYYPLDMAI